MIKVSEFARKLQLLQPTMDDWFSGKFVAEASEIDGDFTNEFYVLSPKTGMIAFFTLHRKVFDADGDLQVSIFRHFETGCEFHILND